MTTWQDRVKQRLEEKGWNMNKLAIVSGYSQSSLSRAMSGDGEIRATRMADVAIALDTTCDWLLHGIDENVTKGRIPVFGQLDDLLQWRCGGTPSEWVSLPGIETLKAPFAWRMDMEDVKPEIRSGDLILMSQEESVSSGSVVLYRIEDRAVCRILHKTATGDLLRSLIIESDPILLDVKADFLGMAVGIWRDSFKL